MLKRSKKYATQQCKIPVSPLSLKCSASKIAYRLYESFGRCRAVPGFTSNHWNRILAAKCPNSSFHSAEKLGISPGIIQPINIHRNQ